MNKLTSLLLLVLLSVACQQEENYKKLRDEVVQFHDVVMNDHGKIIGNQMRLDTLILRLNAFKQANPAIDTVLERKKIEDIIGSLKAAEVSMDRWMREFEPDVSDKSNREAVEYFKKEKLKILRIDSVYKLEIRISQEFLSRSKKVYRKF